MIAYYVIYYFWLRFERWYTCRGYMKLIADNLIFQLGALFVESACYYLCRINFFSGNMKIEFRSHYMNFLYIIYKLIQQHNVHKYSYVIHKLITHKHGFCEANNGKLI